jgi:hypothetical protein
MHPAAVSASINLEFLCLLPDSINSEAGMGLRTTPSRPQLVLGWVSPSPFRAGLNPANLAQSLVQYIELAG